MEFERSEMKKFAGTLRTHMTPEERKLWYKFLKNQPWHVRRQVVFDGYVADFYCSKFKTVIEVDGTQHYETEGLNKDKARDEYFASLKIRVLRYTNRQINQQFNEVCEDIYSVFCGKK